MPEIDFKYQEVVKYVHYIKDFQKVTEGTGYNQVGQQESEVICGHEVISSLLNK